MFVLHFTLQCLDSVKTSCKLSLFNENDVAASGMDLASTSTIPYMPFDPASTEVVLDLGRALYKLMFQLLLLIESNHKISSNVVNHFRQNENVSKTKNKILNIKKKPLRMP